MNHQSTPTSTTCAVRICALPECSERVPDKPPSQPGPQPKFCSRDCQTVAAHRARRARVRAALTDSERLAAVEAELDELRALVERVDWARVPPSALREPAIEERYGLVAGR